MSLSFSLHSGQLEIFNDPSRFKVVAAGRRFGKSFLAAVTLLLEGLKDTAKNGADLSNEEVYYVAPTFDQAKRIMWPLLKQLGKLESEGGVIKSTLENVAVITLVNGRRISIKGADRPDTLRGVGLSYVVMDEYAFMKPDVWEYIISPCLAKSEGGALFIGTPEGKNHFYDLWVDAQTGKFEDAKAWQFFSKDNPTLTKKEIAAMARRMSVAAVKQELEASFTAGGGTTLPERYWKYGEAPMDADTYIAVDLAGFSNAGTVSKAVLKRLDESAIVVCRVNQDGWWIEDIIHGQWDVRETATRIIQAYRDYRPIKLGIEKGITKNAVMPYLDDEMKRYQRYFTVWELTHGGKQKADRILWSLQGRLEKGRITINNDLDRRTNGQEYISPGWQRKLVEQANDFPNQLAHDDLIDALSYIDQLADVVFYDAEEQDERNSWQVLDIVAGF